VILSTNTSDESQSCFRDHNPSFLSLNMFFQILYIYNMTKKYYMKTRYDVSSAVYQP